MKKLLHKLFGVGKHTWRKARLTEDRDLKYCECGETRTVKHRNIPMSLRVSSTKD